MGELVRIPITTGLQQKTEEHLTAQLVSMRNCRYAKTGSLSHRYGMQDLFPSATTDTAGDDLQQQQFCTQVGPELITVGGGAVHSVKDRGYSAAPYMYRGRYDCVAVERRPVIYEQRQITAWDMCAHNHLGVDTYATARVTTELLDTTVYTKVALQFTSAEDGTVIGPDLLAEDGTNTIYFVRCVSLGGKLHVFWLDGTADEIYGRSYDASTSTWGTKTTIHVTLNGSRSFAVCTMGTHILLVCEGTTAGQTVVVTVVDSALAYVTATLITEAETLHGAFSIRATSGEGVWVVWGGGRTGVSNYIRYAVLETATYGVDYGPDTIGEHPDTTDEVTLWGVSSTRSSATSEVIVWDRAYDIGTWDSGRVVQYQEVTNAGGTTFTPPVTHWAQRALSSVWSRNDSLGDPHYYVVLSNANAVAPSAVVSELMMSGTALQAQQVAVVAPRQVGFTQRTSTASISEYAFSSVVASAGGAAFLIPIATDPFSYDIYIKSFRVGLETVALTYDDQPSGEVFDRSLALVGGIPSVYGGQAVRELVPLHEPPAAITSIDIGTASGTPSTTRVYQVRFTYQWRGDDGRVYESAPSSVRTITLTDDGYSHPPYCDVPCLHMTGSERPPYDKQTVRIVAYRTVANGSVFYRASWHDYDPATGASWALSNPNYPTSRIVLGTSSGMDDGPEFLRQPVLYTEGGVLSNSPPPNATIVVAHAGRLWLAGTEDDRIWLSKIIVPEEGPGFNPSLTLDPFEGGRVKAMGSLDDKLIVFKERSIHVLFGDGPDDRGVGSTLTDPQLISSDVGCSNPRSIAVTAMGMVFQSTDGVPYLLTRQLQIVPIGKAIETDFAGLTVSAAVVVQDASELHLYCSESDKRFVLDLYHSAPDNPVWSVDVLSYPAHAACLYQGLSTYVCSASDGAKPHMVFQEDRSARFDRTYGASGGDLVSMSFLTGWIGAKAGWARIKKVGLMLRRQGVHDATIAVSRDYDTATAVDFEFTNTEVSALSAGAPFLICDPPVQKVSSVRVAYEDSYDDPVEDGTASTIEAVVLEIEQKPGMVRQQKGLRK